MNKPDKEDKYIGIYTDVVFIILFPLTIISIVLYFIYGNEIIESDHYISLVWISVSLSLLFAGYLLLKDFSLIRVKTFRNDFVKTYFFSLFFGFLFLLSAVNWSNSIFGVSELKVHNVEITRKNKSVRIRKGIKRDRHYIHVKSWNQNKKDISISVGRNDFTTFQEGDIVSISTKIGFWGLEYIEND